MKENLMKGLRYRHHENRGISSSQWCLEIEGKKLHICTYDDTNRSQDRSLYIIGPCDGKCHEELELPDWYAKELKGLVFTKQ
jgi:hypothetical protein